MRTPSSILPLALVDVTFAAGGRTIVDAITCEIGPSARTVIVGPNGAGKSVLMRLCHGLLAPTTGRIEWRDAGASAVGRRQAMVFQRPVMLRRSAQANIEYALALHGVPRRDRRSLARDALGRVGLGHLAERPARVLSGGEQQRLAIARAWALRPEVVFLDEPTASLDPDMADKTRSLLKRIKEDEGLSILYTSHNMKEMEEMCDRVIFMDKGRIIATGDPESILREFGGRTLEEVFIKVARPGR